MQKRSWESSLRGSSVCSVAEPSARVDVDAHCNTDTAALRQATRRVLPSGRGLTESFCIIGHARLCSTARRSRSIMPDTHEALVLYMLQCCGPKRLYRTDGGCPGRLHSGLPTRFLHHPFLDGASCLVRLRS